MPEVELPALVEVGLVDVGLDEICARTAIGVGLLLLDLILNLRQSATILDVLAPIAEFTRFDNPYIFLFRTIFFLQRFKSVVAE